MKTAYMALSAKQILALAAYVTQQTNNPIDCFVLDLPIRQDSYGENRADDLSATIRHCMTGKTVVLSSLLKR